MEILNEQVITAWVLEHPAHFQLLAPFIRNGTEDDLLIITTRIECLNMFKHSEKYLPKREVIFVERPFGIKKNKLSLTSVHMLGGIKFGESHDSMFNSYGKCKLNKQS